MEPPQVISQAFVNTVVSFLKVLKTVYSVFPKSRGVVLQVCLINQSDQKKSIHDSAWGDLRVYICMRVSVYVESEHCKPKSY